MMRLLIELKKYFFIFLSDPKPLAAGIIAPSVILIAFTLLFGGLSSLPLAIVNNDRGQTGKSFVESFENPINPLGGKQYFKTTIMDEAQAEKAFLREDICGYVVIPLDFTQKFSNKDQPKIIYRLNNYNSDFGKNLRLYLEEIILDFHQKKLPGWNIKLVEIYENSVMIQWVDIIASGSILLAALIGGMFCGLYLVFKEKDSGTIRYYRSSTHGSSWAYLARFLISLLLGIICGSFNMLLASLLTGENYFKNYLLFIIVFILSASAYIGLSSILSMMIKGFFGAAMSAMFSSIIIWFISGGLTEYTPERYSVSGMISACFPNEFALRILRERIFNLQDWQKPYDWFILIVLAILFITGGAVIDRYKNFLPATRLGRKAGLS